MSDAEEIARAFKTAWFTKAARKARIKDDELCEAIEEVRNGQVDDLGGGVFKKRLNKNMHRSIILAKGGRYWIYEFLFAKKDQANIDDRDLEDFRTLAKKICHVERESDRSTPRGQRPDGDMQWRRKASLRVTCPRQFTRPRRCFTR